jgi:FkbM family methyltransferase
MVSESMLRPFIELVKPLIARWVYPVGSVATILRGPARGLKYRVFPSGLAPLYGGGESAAQRIFAEQIRNGAVCYDIGANYGIHTLLLARLVGSAGHVYAFEPVPKIYNALKENVALNQFGNVTCECAAVAEQNGKARFVLGESDCTGHLHGDEPQGTDSFSVILVSLDDYVFEQQHRSPTFIKIDVEGAEGKVMLGARRVVERFRPLMLIDLHTPEQDVSVGRMLQGSGYQAFRTEGMQRIKELGQGWPQPDGIWGQILAVPG